MALFRKANGALSQARAGIIELKDRARFWVFMVEWLVITATLMVSGLVLWTLMVNRRFYRAVEPIRFN